MKYKEKNGNSKDEDSEIKTKPKKFVEKKEEEIHEDKKEKNEIKAEKKQDSVKYVEKKEDHQQHYVEKEKKEAFKPKP